VIFGLHPGLKEAISGFGSADVRGFIGVTPDEASVG
jgi:hypothetical protein